MNVNATAPPPTATRLAGLDRFLIGIAFLASTVVTASAAFIAQDRTAECQAIRSQRITEVENFRAVASNFEPLVSTYMGDALKGRNVDTSKGAVLLSLRQQRAKLAYVKPHLDEAGRIYAQRFDEAVVNFVVKADDNPTGVNVGPLYQELNYIYLNNQKLIEATNRVTGMDNKSASAGSFLSECFDALNSQIPTHSLPAA